MYIYIILYIHTYLKPTERLYINCTHHPIQAHTNIYTYPDIHIHI